MSEHFQVVFRMKMVPAVSIILVRTSTVSPLILKCLLNLRVSALTLNEKISIYSRYGLFLEITHELLAQFL